MAFDARKYELEERVIALQKEINEIIVDRDKYKDLARERHEVIARLLTDQAATARA
jgi:hypothetical protein